MLMAKESLKMNFLWKQNMTTRTDGLLIVEYSPFPLWSK